MDANKQRQEVSLIGQILSLEVLLAMMGMVSLVYGVMKAEIVNIVIGAVIICGLALLMMRKKSPRQ